MTVKMLNLLPISFRFQAVILNTSQMPHSQKLNPIPRLSFTKPSWVVQTESNVHKEKIRNPDPPCLVCSGSGRVDCHNCQGRGRTNCTHLEMLPKGEWPKWCKTCGGSGLGYCDRCIGTGEYRDIMGFHFMKRETKDSPAQTDQKRRTIADLYNSELSADA